MGLTKRKILCFVGKTLSLSTATLAKGLRKAKRRRRGSKRSCLVKFNKEQFSSSSAQFATKSGSPFLSPPMLGFPPYSWDAADKVGQDLLLEEWIRGKVEDWVGFRNRLLLAN